MESKVNILLVEDDPNLGILLNEYLGARGFNSVLAKGASDHFPW